MNTPYPFRRGLLAQHVALGSRPPRHASHDEDATPARGANGGPPEARQVSQDCQRETKDAPAA